MIAALRAGALLVNVAIAFGVPLLLGAPWPWALATALLFFLLVGWACAALPRTEPADGGTESLARELAARMGAPAPRWVRTIEGVTAAAVRVGLNGYGLLIGRSVRPDHVEAVLAHEIAHHVEKDLLWEPLTDGPARLALPVASSVVLFWPLVFPFFLFGAPLARTTELRADRLAAAHVSSYPVILKELTSGPSGRPSLLYPTVTERLRSAARDSLSNASSRR